MTEFQEENSFDCPYCASANTLLVDVSGGREQVMTTDCEVCCKPIVLTVTIDDEGMIDVQAEREA